jgi:hypothetical protein
MNSSSQLDLQEILAPDLVGDAMKLSFAPDSMGFVSNVPKSSELRVLKKNPELHQFLTLGASSNEERRAMYVEDIKALFFKFEAARQNGYTTPSVIDPEETETQALSYLMKPRLMKVMIFPAGRDTSALITDTFMVKLTVKVLDKATTSETLILEWLSPKTLELNGFIKVDQVIEVIEKPGNEVLVKTAEVAIHFLTRKPTIAKKFTSSILKLLVKGKH